MCGDESCKCGGPVITGLSVVSAGQSRSTGSDTWWHRVQNLYYVVVAMNTEPLACCSEILEGVVRVLNGLNVICDRSIPRRNTNVRYLTQLQSQRVTNY